MPDDRMMRDWRRMKPHDEAPQYKLFVYSQLETSPQRILPVIIEYFGLFVSMKQFIKAVVKNSPKEISEDAVMQRMRISTNMEHYDRAEGHPDMLFRRAR